MKNKILLVSVLLTLASCGGETVVYTDSKDKIETVEGYEQVCGHYGCFSKWCVTIFINGQVHERRCTEGY